jgi:aryl-alcohol dehydrogenase-like predicted oxidoreductase
MPYGIANRSGQPATAEVAAMLARAHAVGIHTIDTARAYGESEALIGALAPPDSGWRVVTKLAPDVLGDEPADGAAGDSPLGLGEVLERVAASLEASRRALDRDVLPVLLLHRFAHRHACGGRVWRYLLAEREAGRIGALGVSAATPEQAWAALEDPDIEALQVATSLLDLRLHRQGFFARARELGRTVYVRSVFLQGLGHLEPNALPAALAALAGAMEAIRQTAREMSVPARALYLAFVRELPGVHPVVGCEMPQS